MEAEVINQLNNTLNDLEKRSEDIRVYMDYQGKKDRLEEVIGLSEDPELWNDPKRAQEIGKERKILEGIVLTLDNIASGIEDNRMLIEMTVEENDEEGFAAVQEDVAGLEKQMAGLGVQTDVQPARRPEQLLYRHHRRRGRYGSGRLGGHAVPHVQPLRRTQRLQN